MLIALLALLGTRVAWSADPGGLAAAARSILGAGQGVFVQAADGTVLLGQAAATPVHPASVSKVPTTLALLRKFGPGYRFVTTFAADGRIVGGTLYGDLVVESDGDPSLVDEDALLVAERLNALGLKRVTGSLRPQGSLTFDWQPDPDGVQLRRALSGMAPAAAWTIVRALDASGAAGSGSGLGSLLPPGIEFASAAARPVADLATVATSGGTGAPARRSLIIYRSQPLLPLLKSLDDYSNNILKPLADAAGGAAAVQALARSLVPAAMRSEITLGDGAGTDPRNRLSPRAAVQLLRALDQQLAASGHSLVDVLPVAGIDQGTLRNRLNAPGEAGRVAGKTGTYGSYGASALVGAIPTTDRGTVYFAILDHGVPVPEARRRQDRFVRVLLAHLHSTRWNYQPDARPAVARAQVSSGP